MRKTHSLPCLNRAPLHPQSRPSGVPQDVAWSEYRAPALRWENPNVKQLNLTAYQERTGWAGDAFHIHRPLNQRLERKKPEKVWRFTDAGTKYAFNERTASAKDAAAGSWDLFRPANHCAPPWRNSVYPRALYSSVACSSGSVVQ
ncbi:unnamed protein product [Effrenium voratum]|nr:unnamed protein product [Effrenium voratum]|mmetsp:Transcript_116640/g.277269  ORF Transcript_116640/g.277269 Transcript_116640/m.277269 type:complete len:145 (-) Transcript_116640:23-457(-)